MLDNQFDKILKEKLGQLKIDDQVAGWEAFEQKHSAELGSSGEELDQFDALIKNKLGGMTAASGSDWDSFESKFSGELQDDLGFDQSLKDSLNQMRASFEPSHWEILKLRLEKILDIRKSIFTSKSFEVIIMLLLLITFVNNLHLFTFQEGKLKTDQANTTPLFAESLNINNSIETNLSTELEDISTVATAYSLNTQSKEDLNAEENNTVAKPQLIAAAQGVNDLINSNTINKPNTIVEKNILAVIAITEKTTPADLERNQVLNTNSLNPSQSISNSSVTSSLEHLSKEMSLFDISERTLSLSKLNVESLEEISEINESKMGVWFHTVISHERNQIESFYGQIQGEDNYMTTSNGYSAGILMGLEKDKWSLTTGFKMGNYSYVPFLDTEEIVVELEDGSGALYEIYLEEIEHNTLSVPLSFNYELAKSKNWSLFTSTGVNLNLISTTNYTFNKELLTEIPAGFLPPVIQTDQYEGVFADKNFVSGLSQGGRFGDVASLYVNAGFGIQRNFGNSLALYVQPMYQHQVINSKLQPNLDQIHKLNVNFGMKFKFDVRNRADR